MQLDTESLRAFLAVLDTGGMTSAADELGLTQSAVSWKIKRLEQRVGRELLIRDGHSLSPSHDGRTVMASAREIVALHDRLVLDLASSDLTGLVQFGATEELAPFCTGSVLARFNRVHPGAQIEFIVDKGAELFKMLNRNQLDVAVFQVGPDDVQPSDTVLWTDDLVWVSAPDWTYDEGEVPLITFGEGGFYRPHAEAVLKEAGVPFRVSFSGPSTASVLAAVEVGLGVALLSERSVSGDVIEWPRSADLRPIPPGSTIARPAPGEPSMVATELIADITAELVEV